MPKRRNPTLIDAAIRARRDDAGSRRELDKPRASTLTRKLVPRPNPRDGESGVMWAFDFTGMEAPLCQRCGLADAFALSEVLVCEGCDTRSHAIREHEGAPPFISPDIEALWQRSQA